MRSELEVEIFRTGDYGPKGKWDEQSLDRIAESYNTQTHEAPVTLDHAQSGPALGWVAGLKRRGDRLVARLRDLSDEMVGLLKSGAFKKRSVELYKAMPETTGPYLKAVSFLGAGAPAVKGLQDVLFAERQKEASGPCAELGETCSFEFSESAEETEPIIGANPPTPMGEEDSSPSAESAAAPVQTSPVNFAELTAELRRQGRWLPSWKEASIERFFQTLGELGRIEIDRDSLQWPAQWFAQFLKSLPEFIPMGEQAAPEPRSAQISIPSGDNVSAESIGLHREAVALRERRPELSYAQAVCECARI